MQPRHRPTLLAAALLGALAALPGAATAQVACADLPTLTPLAGNTSVYSVTAAMQTSPGGRAYCMVNVTWRDPSLVGSAAGYAPGGPPTVDTFENLRMGFALPANTNSGSAAWGGRLIMTAGGGAQGSVPSLTSMIDMNPAAVGSGTDSGHGDANSGSGDNWGVIQDVSLNYGKVKDWAGGRANGTAVVLAKQLAATYYGTGPSKTYWNGCSGGGHMGWAQVMNYPQEYDGALIGAAAFHWQKFRLADSWDELARKKLQLKYGQTITSDQQKAANQAATAACDRADGVADGIVADPRACTWSAKNNICGSPAAPASPLCLTQEQAATMDTIWDGPRNSKGQRIWHPYERGVDLGTATTTQSSTAQVLRWTMYDDNFDSSNLYMDQESIDLAAGAGIDVSKAITYENAAVLDSQRTADWVDDDDPALLKAAHDKGMKIITYHGLQDPAIHDRNDMDFYRQVATYYNGGKTDYAKAQSWYRLFLTPGAPHCGTQYAEALDALVSWVEDGTAPASMVHTGGVPKGCPFPQRAIYKGGDTTSPDSYACGGNLDANLTALCQMPRAKYKREKGWLMNWDEIGIQQGVCAAFEHLNSQ